MAIQVNIHEAKSQLSKLIDAACSGEEVIVAKAGKPIVELRPIKPPKSKQRQLGRWKGRIHIRDDFDDPLPEFEDYM